jgi:glycosyltransferase involved in cell wall biosynthesis
MYLSIVVPCYNEEKNIEKFHKEIRNVLASIPFEIIFVNDGSKDHTDTILKRISQIEQNIHYISFSRNFGKEAAMLAGLEFSDGDAVIIMDADLQHPPALIPEVLQKFHEGYDQVIAKRNRKGETFLRSKLSMTYYRLMNMFVDVELVDGVGDFRLLSRRAVDSLLSLKEYNRFSKGLFAWIGFKEYIVEYDNVLREDGESKWSFPKLLNYGIDGLISFNNKPLRASIYIGFSITLLAALYVFVMLIKIMLYGIDEPGYFTLIAAILLIGGIQLIFLGVIGEYIGRIYYETKKRPHYVIQEQTSRAEIHSREFGN